MPVMKKHISVVTLASVALASATMAQVPAEAWRIGPVIKGRNYSEGMPPSLKEGRQGPFFDFPLQSQGSVHYVSLDTGPLAGARTITVRYRIDAARGVAFRQQQGSPNGGEIGLSFQRAGDNWSARGRYETYRWYSHETQPLTPGVHTFTARLDDPLWAGVMTSTARSNPEGFRAALANTQSVSLTFGGDKGRGHGVYSTGPARFTLLGFSID